VWSDRYTEPTFTDYLLAALPANRRNRTPALGWAGVTLKEGGTLTMSVLKSRKFWAAVAMVVYVVAKNYIPDLPIDESQAQNIGLVLMAYILGTALEDGLSAGK
jgi:hypothetical protein